MKSEKYAGFGVFSSILVGAGVLFYIAGYEKEIGSAKNELIEKVISEKAEIVNSITETKKSIISSFKPVDLPPTVVVSIADGTEKKWFKDGELHRFFGPALIIEKSNYIIKVWYQYGTIHNSSGPAFTCEGKCFSKENNFLVHLNKVISPNDGFKLGFRGYLTPNETTTNDYDMISGYVKEFWAKNGRLHRDDGPAVIYTDGSEEWWSNGRLHRDNGPAIIHKNGYKAWWQNNKLLHHQR